MKLGLAAWVWGSMLAVYLPGMAFAQAAPPPPAPPPSGVAVTTAPEPKRFELSTSPAAREATRPREAGFYPEDVRVRHEPAFVEPLTHTPASGPVKKMGASLWTAPAGRGSLLAQPPDVPGWLGFGFTLTWE